MHFKRDSHENSKGDCGYRTSRWDSGSPRRLSKVSSVFTTSSGLCYWLRSIFPIVLTSQAGAEAIQHRSHPQSSSRTEGIGGLPGRASCGWCPAALEVNSGLDLAQGDKWPQGREWHQIQTHKEKRWSGYWLQRVKRLRQRGGGSG